MAGMGYDQLCSPAGRLPVADSTSFAARQRNRLPHVVVPVGEKTTDFSQVYFLY